MTALNQYWRAFLTRAFLFLMTQWIYKNFLLTRRFFSTLAFFSMQTVFFIYLQGKGLSNSEIAFSLSLLFFCNQALAILASIWGDRFGLAKMMLLGCFLDVIAYIFFLSADNYILLLIATTCFGLGSCFVWYQCESLPTCTCRRRIQRENSITGKIFKSHLHVVYVCAFVGDSIYQIQSHWVADLGLLCDGSGSLCPNG